MNTWNEILQNGTKFKNAVCGDTALYFRNAEGVVFRLTHQGVCGWRLQSVGQNGDFCDLGASQSIARYMGEELAQEWETLRFEVTENTVTAHAPDGTCAILTSGAAPLLSFYSPVGTKLCDLIDLSVLDGKVAVSGDLADGEGVFGGGERFDAANQRGRTVELYTSDGWNRSDTTYLAIPLFFTTRGMGLFFNHYEPAYADFGETDGGRWRYTMECDRLDLYLFATGEIRDLYRGYAALSGHADQPAPWMHGVQICRSGYDMSSFDVDQSYDTLEQIPDYKEKYLKRGESYVLLPDATDAERESVSYVYAKQDDKFVLAHLKNDAGRYYRCGYQSNPIGDSVKTIMERFIAEGMKPDAAIMEGFGWGGAYSDSDASRAKHADLKRAVDWLHERGIKAMVYIRAGGVRSDAIGFCEAYKVHANVDVLRQDGAWEHLENTTQIPWMMGKASNPDGSKRADDYLDITNDEALEWYFDRIWGDSIELGLDGVKIDFCECMPDGGKQYATTRTQYLWKNPDRMLPGTEHHAYATYFISRFYQRMQELQREKKLGEGFMVLSRGGGIGSQRSPYMWAGDQVRTFEKLDDMLLSTVTSGLSGVPFMTYDMGGYHYEGKLGYYREGQKEYETEVFLRALEFTAFTTNIQTHGDVRHVYEMSEDAKELYRLYTTLHAKLIPYISKLSSEACREGIPPVRHPVLYDLADKELYDRIDEFMLGDGLLIAPMMKEGQTEREVYLPRGNWIDLCTGKCLSGNATVKARANIGQIPVYLNADSEHRTELEAVFASPEWKQITEWQ